MNKEKIREIELDEIVRLKQEIAEKDLLNTDFEREIEDWADGWEPDFYEYFDIKTPAGSQLYAAISTAVDKKIEYKEALSDVQNYIENYIKEQVDELHKKIEEIQTYGIEIACPELIEELAYEKK